ncbi:hypothetical protein FOE78_04810 [Microlunatus elymi]|uniref:Post-SET domain-containing protein n=1 Tax=Microlunatus elymi TaxID=2596828 RepID=A0A516PVX2_9ACTN|nr:hypothetical protein [Microlunatus elymi]QDP95323.1 hypothetical protein FOE78_04810 [Microlunatus elymi]
MIQEDLDLLAVQTPTVGAVVEGALIAPAFAPLSRSVWLMPSSAEHQRRLTHRSGSTGIHHGLLYGHRLITEQLSGTAASVINVDGQTIAETLAAVETALGPALDELPVAQTISERRATIRYGNHSLTDQLRFKIDNGQADPTQPESRGFFDCECGRPGCTATIRLRPIDAIRLTDREPGAIHAEKHPDS